MKSGLSLRQRVALEAVRPIARRVRREHPLTTLFWECTLRCNLSCRHCGSDCRVQSAVPDMPLGDFLPVLDSIAAATDPHRVMINVTGGEPLLRHDLEVCGQAFYAHGFPWGIVTNGWLLTPERLRSLLASGLRAVTVSLDGTAPSHDWMRGRPGSFDRAFAAIRNLAAAGDALTFDVVTCVNRRNLSELPRIKDQLLEAGVGRWRLFTVFPVGRAAEDPLLRLSGDEMRQLMDFIHAVRTEGRLRCSYGCEGFLGPWEGKVRDHFFTCGAGVTIGSVLADGSIAACPSIRADYSEGNIYRGDDFIEVWNARYARYRNRTWMRRDACAACDAWRYCEGNGMHLRDADGRLLFCHLHRLTHA